MPLNMIPQLSRPYDSMFQPMPQEQPFPTNLQSIGDLTGTLQGMTARAGNEQDRAPVLIQQNADRTITIKNVPPETLKFHDTASKFYMQALGQYSQEAQRLQLQEEEARRHPLLGALTNIAGNLAANDPTLPGWVRALGQSSLQLNPRPDDIARQRMAVGAAGAEIANKAAELGMQGEQLGVQQQNAATARLKALADVDKETQDRAWSFRKEAMTLAAAQQMDPASLAAFGVQGGYIDEKDAPGLVETLSDIKRVAASTADEKQARELTTKLTMASLEAERQTQAQEASLTRLQATLASQNAIADKRLQAVVGRDQEKRGTLTRITATQATKMGVALENLKKAQVASDEAAKYFTGIKGSVLGMSGKTGDILRQVAFPSKKELEKAEGVLTKLKASLLDALGSEGLSFAKTSEKEMEVIRDVVANPTRKPEQNRQVLQYWIDKIGTEYKFMLAAYPDADWGGKYNKLLPPDMAKLYAESSPEPEKVKVNVPPKKGTFTTPGGITYSVE